MSFVLDDVGRNSRFEETHLEIAALRVQLLKSADNHNFKPADSPAHIGTAGLALAAEGFLRKSSILGPDLNVLIRDYFGSQLPGASEEIKRESRDDEEVSGRRMSLLQKGIRYVGAVGVIGGAVFVGAEVHHLLQKVKQPEAVALDGAIKKIDEASKSLMYRPAELYGREEFSEPQKAVVEIRAASMTVELPEEVARRLSVMGQDLETRFPDRKYIAGDPPIPDIRARLKEEREKVEALAEAKREGVERRFGVLGGVGGGVGFGALVSIFGLSYIRGRIKKGWDARGVERTAQLSKISRAATKLGESSL